MNSLLDVHHDDHDHHEDLQPDHKSDSVVELSPHHIVTMKCVGILIMMGLTTIFCLLPYRTYSCQHRQRLISFANCFGGGVLFGTIFLHLIPEVSFQMNAYMAMVDTSYPLPLAEALEVLGFCLILFLETACEQVSLRKLNRGGFAKDCEKCDQAHEDLHRLQNISPDQCLEDEKSAETSSGDTILADKYTLITPISNAPKRCVVEERHNIGILLLSLATHSIFEGVAVGVETQTQTIFGLMGAILIHKCAIALTLGSRLVTQEMEFKKGCVYAVILAVATPLGIVLGVAVEAKLTGSTLVIVTAVIQALATGIFLYITFAEILFSELKKKVDMKFKIPCICFGITIIALSSMLHTHNHVIGAHGEEGLHDEHDHH